MEEDTKELKHIREIIPRLFSEAYIAELEKQPKPPYDSPLEEIFAEHCLKYLSPSVHAEKQLEVQTKHGVLRVDFRLSSSNRRVAIECDGKDFHNMYRDELRDAILIGEKHFDTVYHFRGCDLVYYPYDCIWLMSVLDKELFNKRSHLQLNKLSKLTFEINDQKAEEEESFLCNINPPNLFFWAFRRTDDTVHKSHTLNYFWKTLYRFACKYPRSSLDELLAIIISGLDKDSVGT